MSEAPRTVGVIQARMNSQRFPGKILKPLAGAPLLQRLIERASRARRLHALVVATSDRPADDAIARLCDGLGVKIHRGSESDVLRRVLDAAEAAGAGVVVRLTGDNPFVDGRLIDMVVDALLGTCPPPDYAHNVEESGFPFGLFVEACRVEVLRAAATSRDPSDREHVTWYVRRRPHQFRHVCVRTEAVFSERNLSIDTADDYLRLKPVFEKLYAANPAFDHAALAACGPAAG